jgi:hypothetical protein
MKYFSINLDDLESPQFLAASNDQIANFIFLHGLFSKLQNGGTIPDAASLPERYWSRHGIDITVLKAPSPLWTWEGDALSLAFYDITGQTLFEKKVAGGKKGGRGRGNRTPSSTPNGTTRTDKIILEEKRLEEKRECDTLARGEHSLVSRIKSLRSGWEKPTLLTAKERPIFEANREVFESFTEDDWNTQRRYLAARLPEGDPGWQPKSLIQYLDNPSDVMSHAHRWKSKQRPAPAPRPSPAPQEQSPEDKQALAEFLKSGILKAKIS